VTTLLLGTPDFLVDVTTTADVFGGREWSTKFVLAIALQLESGRRKDLALYCDSCVVSTRLTA
jgi:hypothetical protein